MALINCPECNKQVSDKAEQCIHCGYPIHKYIDNHSSENTENTSDNYVEGFYYDVIILDVGAYSSDVLVRYTRLTGVNGVEGRKIIDTRKNIIILESVSKESAELVKKVLEACGALVEMRVNPTSNVENVIDIEDFKKRSQKILNDPLPPYRDPSLPPVCPNCGSTAITAGPLTYRWSSGRTINRCANCGHSWEPK